MKPLKIIFAGTPDFAARHLQALLNSSHEIVAVYTQPDRPAGRGKKLTPSPVKKLAAEHQLPIYQPATLRNESAQAELKSLNADIMVVVAYGLILPKIVLDTPKLGCINVHGSLLPRWRGAAPIQRALWAGDKATGVTIMQMDIGLDTGDMLLTTHLPIEDTDTSASLYEKLAEQGPEALLEALVGISSGTIKPQKQNEAEANYAEKLTKDEAELDWHKSAPQLWREIRAFNPWPVSFFNHQNQQIKVWQAQIRPHTSQAKPGTIISADKQGLEIATTDGNLLITQMQLPGKKALSVADVLNSRADWFIVGSQLNTKEAD